MKKNFLKILSTGVFIIALVFMTGFFWPIEWGVGLQFLITHFQLTSNFEVGMMFCFCTSIWLSLAFLSGYLDDISKNMK